MDNENNKLISAEPTHEEYAPVLRVLIAASYMGVLAGIMAAMASLLSMASGKRAGDKLMLSIFAALMFAAAAAVMTLIDSKKRRSFDEMREKEKRSAVKYAGKVVSAKKHTRRVNYGNDNFDEVTWSFVIEYKDENGDTVTVGSGRYLNDITAVLGSRDIDVYKYEDGHLTFGEFDTSGGIKLDAAADEEE